MRRREMVLRGGELSHVLYELPAPVSIADFDTGFKLFDQPRSFTVLLEAKYNNYQWLDSRISIFAIDSGTTFRLGRLANVKETAQNVSATSTSNFFSGIAMNSNGDAVTTKAASMAARRNSKTVRRNAFRFDLTSLRFEGNNNGSLIAPSTAWWLLSAPIVSNDTIVLNVNTGSTCDVNIFKVYDYAMTDAEVNEFLTAI